MNKSEALNHWQNLEKNLPILPHFRAIPYKATGSKYGTCGIRIDGNPEFIDAVLSRLTDLMSGENVHTRLGLSRNPVNGKGLDKEFVNKEERAECCYIRLHERGNEGKAFACYSRKLAQNTQSFIEGVRK